jgi:NarL family two-component system response regulator LiaR
MRNAEIIKVVVVDDHEVVRKGLSAYISVQDDIQIVGEASDGSQVLDLCKKLSPHVVLMDLVMPHTNGIEAIRELRLHAPEVKVIALTSFQEPDMVKEALREGAISYLLKNVSGEDLSTAIRSAVAGKPTLAPEVTMDLVMREKKQESYDALTQREKEVLGLMVEGSSNPDIAKKLFISRSTARAHVSNILSKLSVSNRAEAVAFALRNKLVK